jgi:D-xylono/L-arabinono-1,4-lactonase
MLPGSIVRDDVIQKRGPTSTPAVVANCSCHIGENPVWHPLEKRVYWCDIPKGRLFRYDPSTGDYEKCYEGEEIGGFTIQSDGSLLLFMARGAIRQWRDGDMKTVLEEIRDERDSRFNDVIADPAGRVFCGTMPTPKRLGRLYRLDRDAKLTVVLEEIGCSNGMAFSVDRKRMYYTDSVARTIYLFDYDQRTGNLDRQRIFVKTDEADGVPDGATVDADGCLWSAQWDGSCVIRYGREGKEDRRIVFPVRKVSSLTFGGADYSDLYVTTAGGGIEEEGRCAGSLFRLASGYRGLPEFTSRVCE